MYQALGLTGLVYVLIALGVFGALTVNEVIGYGETAIAEAACPPLGDAGFTDAEFGPNTLSTAETHMVARWRSARARIGRQPVSGNASADLGAQERKHEVGDLSGVLVKRPVAEPFKEFDPRGREGRCCRSANSHRR